MTIDELLHESNLIEGYDSPEADACSKRAWEWLMEVDQHNLTHTDICRVQALVVAHQDDLRPEHIGYYRDHSGVNVTVGGRRTPIAMAVPALMADWLYLIPEKPPLLHHVEFEKIHPFVDGNGRTGRILLWWWQYREGKKYTEITYNNRYNYYQWFDSRITQDETLLRILHGVDI